MWRKRFQFQKYQMSYRPQWYAWLCERYERFMADENCTIHWREFACPVCFYPEPEGTGVGETVTCPHCSRTYLSWWDPWDFDDVQLST